MTVQALARRRFGLRRPPVVTAVVFAVTAATSVLGLLLPGVLAEQVVGAPRWLACYFGAGLAGELAGYAWQPRGAGNSVAICGLAHAAVALEGPTGTLQASHWTLGPPVARRHPRP